MIIMGATEDFRSSTNPIKRNNFFHHNLSYHQQPFLLSVLWHSDFLLGLLPQLRTPVVKVK